MSLRAMNGSFHVFINVFWLTKLKWLHEMLFWELLKSLRKTFMIVRNGCSAREKGKGWPLCYISTSHDLHDAEQLTHHTKSMPSLCQDFIKSKPRVCAFYLVKSVLRISEQIWTESISKRFSHGKNRAKPMSLSVHHKSMLEIWYIYSQE